MREITITCDLCKKEIEGEPIGYWLCRTDRMSMDITEDYFHPDLDICDSCADVLTAKISEVFDQNKEKDQKEKTKKKVTNKEGTPKKELDTGKIRALREAGWSLEKIADEIGCSPQTVANRLAKMGGKDE